MDIQQLISQLPSDPAQRIEAIERLKDALHAASPIQQPVDRVRWVPIEQVTPNDYNPNRVAKVEMRLLLVSIWQDGYTQPIVTIYDPERAVYVIVDGFHRYWTARNSPEVLERNHGRVPIVVIEKPIADRMASTVRHNRARGKHQIKGMGSMVYALLQQGWDDARICNELGMEPEELSKLKHLTGFAAFFAGRGYNPAYDTHNQLNARKPEDTTDGT